MNRIFLLALPVLALGGWAVCLKEAVSRTGTPWTYLATNVWVIPVSIWLLHGEKAPESRAGLGWGVLAGLLGAIGFVSYLQAMKRFPGPIVASVGALYPLVAFLIFWMLGEKVSSRQILGLMLAVVSLVLLVKDDG